MIGGIGRVLAGTRATVIISCHNLAITRIASLHGRLHSTNVGVVIVGGGVLRHTIRNASCRSLGDAFINPATMTFSSRSTVTPTGVLGGFTSSRRTLRVGNNFVRGGIRALSGVGRCTALPDHRSLLSVLTDTLRSPVQGVTHTIGTITSGGDRRRTTWTSRHAHWVWEFTLGHVGQGVKKGWA